jgi:ribonuclease HI
MACLGITSAMPTAPTAALEVITGLNPLSLYIQRSAMATAYRLSLYGMQPRISDRMVGGHMQIWGYLNRVPQLTIPSDYLIPEFDFLKRFQTVIPLRSNWMEGKIKDHPNAKICFTDGSKVKGESPVSGKSGAGVYSKTDSFNESVPLGIYTTVFQAEVYAIKHCADKLSDSPRESYIIINSDSQAAINAIQNPRTISKIVKEARNALNALAKDRTVILRWIPGHSNILGNEEADTLAKAGVMQPRNEHDPNIGLAPNIGKFFINSWAETAHFVRWQAEQKCRQAKEIITKLPSNSTVRWLLSLKRNEIRLLVGILCGHCGLNRHLHLMRLANSPNCNFCGDSELSFHFLCECPRYDVIRMNTLGKAVVSKEEVSKLPWKDIMAFILKSQRF